MHVGRLTRIVCLPEHVSFMSQTPRGMKREGEPGETGNSSSSLQLRRHYLSGGALTVAIIAAAATARRAAIRNAAV
jgi:hypothetical protein